MAMITPEEVCRRIEMYFNGGIVEYLKPRQITAARRGIRATRNNHYDDQPLTLQTARPACERFIEKISDYPGKFAGRGIVICGGGIKYFPCAWVCINMLRHLGCSLPIELWHLEPQEMDGEMKALLEPLNVQCIDALEVRKTSPSRRLGGWELKPYAILHTGFREVLLLDADNVPVVNPEFLFESKPYKNRGAIFWPDYGQFKKSQIIWDNCGLERPPGPEFESGQIVVDKQRCWQALSLAMWFNEQSDFYYEHLHGDKETFHLAFCKLEKSFAMPARRIQPLYATMCQHDFQGKRIFQHRNTDKWNLFLTNKEVRGFRYETKCRAFVRQLQQLWDGRTGRYVRPKKPERSGLSSNPAPFEIVACIISCLERRQLREQTVKSLRDSSWPSGSIHIQLDKGGSAKTRQESQAHTTWLALRHASEIYVIGYSLPPEDLHARLTIRSAIRGNEKFEPHKPKIAVVNPDRNIYLRFARLMNGSVKYYETGLQGISLRKLVGDA